jgi:hypothetical protein
MAAKTIHPGSKEQFFNDKADCLWVRCTHLRHVEHVPFFRSFVLIGNEDCPEAIYLYRDEDPLVTDKPLTVINLLELEVAA